MPENLFIFPVIYTDNENKIYPNIIKRYDEEIEISLDEAGKYKRSEWKFQNEWRYRLNYMAGGVIELGKNSGKVIHNMRNGIQTSIPYIDLKINDECFKDMEIMTGPKMNDGDKEMLKLICEKYCCSAKIVHSKLKIR